MEKTVKNPDSARLSGKAILTESTRRRSGRTSAEARNQRQQAGDGLTIRIDEVRFGQGVLRRHTPIILHPRLSVCEKYFDVEFEDIDMTLTFSLEENVQAGVEEALSVMWKEYAMEEPSKMTSNAQIFAQHLRATYSLI